MPRLIDLIGQTVQACVQGDLPDKLSSWRRAFEGRPTSSGIVTVPLGTYDFLLTLHSNHGRILYCFQDIARYWPKSVNF